GGIESYTTGISGPNTARVIGAFAVVAGAAADLSAGTEYFGFNLVFNNQKTVGIGNCTGCTTPACVAINRINLYTAPDVLSQILTGPAVGFDSHFVSWQGGGSVAGTCATPGGGIPVTTSTLGRGAVTRSNYSSSYSA